MHLDLAKEIWEKHLRKGDLSIDATCGNGNDTLFLSQFGPVIGLDIQTQAITNTKALVPAATLYQISHSNIDTIQLPCPPRLIVYNLGYLPKGNKSITTQTNSTLISVEKSLRLIASDGAVSITCYPGHDEGQKEEKALLQFLEPMKEWEICYHKWLTRLRSPTFIWITKQTRVR